MPDPDIGALTALRRLRHVETDAARRDLGEALTRETALAARDNALAQELAEARQLSGDFDREAFVAWFGRVRTERARLAEAMQEAISHIEKARTTLAHRRVAETAAEAGLAEAVSAQKTAAGRREQVMLEDVARALKQTPG
ncbi:MAG: hypothetical protein ABSE20_29235 [Acetobacteraceae bacterium]|jgi:hypothetical protein